MDIMGKINEIVAKIKADENFASKFSSDPVQAVESVIGINLPDEQINPIIEGIKAKLSMDNAGGGIFDSIKKLF